MEDSLIKVMPYLIKYLTIQDIGRLSQASRSLAESVLFNDYEWKQRIKRDQCQVKSMLYTFNFKVSAN